MSETQAGRRLTARNPRTGERDYAFSPPGPGELDALLRALRSGQPEWAASALEERAAVLRRWREALSAGREDLQRALSLDTGRWRLAGVEIDAAVWGIEGWCARAPELLRPGGGRSSLRPEVRFESQLVPYPLVGVVSPWNFPLTLSLVDAVPALLAGCAVAIKPSEITPRFIEPLAESIAAVPELAKVLAVFPGDGETGAALVERVDALCFTGSVATGRRVAEAAARRFIPVFLEMGGKDPALVLASADLERATQAILRGSITASGQVCYSIERIYVDEKVHDAFVERLVTKARRVELSYPDIHRGHLGPLIWERQAGIVAEHLADAVAKGATIRCGGELETLGGGAYLRPTVVTGVDHSMALMTEETFGPVLPVMRVAGVDEAVELANDSDYGLSAAVFAGSEEEAASVSRRLQAGAVNVNDAALTHFVLQDVEKNSFKYSGLGGSRMGPAALHRFFRKKAILTNRGEPEGLESLDEAGG